MTAHEATRDRIGGYRVIRRLATGGTSDVLLARAEGPHGFERTVVLKLLLSRFRSDPSFERMFAREAAAYARLSHPAIVKLYDFFADGRDLVMVLEYVDGIPLNKLRALLRQHAIELDDRSSFFIASRVFAALAAAHSATDPQTAEFAPVIHRDVNPSNVLIPWDAHVKLADFGIAKVAGMASDTKTGYIKGTYGYMAPEQVRAESITPRADVYAGGLLLWELLTRRKAIQRGTLSEMEVLRAMAEPSFPSIDGLRPDVAAPIREAIKRALQPVVDRRAIFADEMASILRANANLEEGRALLADALARVRPTPSTEDLEKTIEMGPESAPDTEVPDTEVSGRPRLPSQTRVFNAPAPPQPPRRVVAPPLPPPSHISTPRVPVVTATLARPNAIQSGATLPLVPPVRVPPTRAPEIPGAAAAPMPTFLAAYSPPPPTTFAAISSPPEAGAPFVGEPHRAARRGLSAFALGGIVALGVFSSVMVIGLAWIHAHPQRAEAQDHLASSRASAAPALMTSAKATSRAPTFVVPPSAPASAIPSARSAAVVAPAPSESPDGEIDTSGARPQHRVFVDGRVVGQTPDAFHVRCGAHSVRLGSAGSVQRITVPCGASIHVGDR